MASMNITGLAEWMKWTQQQEQQFDSEVKDIVHKRSHLVERDAKKLAPVDTGELRRSINTEMLDSYTGQISAEALNSQGTDYAPFQEFGTSRHRAQPFMKPAFIKQRNLMTKDLIKAARGIGS